MERPEKKTIKITGVTLDNVPLEDSLLAYNQACDDWEAYHKQEIKKLNDTILLMQGQLNYHRKKTSLPSDEGGKSYEM